MATLNIRRSKYLTFRIEDDEVLDLRKLLRGKVEVERLPVVRADTPFKMGSTVLQEADVALIADLSAEKFVPVQDLVDAGKADCQSVERLVDAGILISDADSPQHRDRRDMEDRLERAGWYPAAMSYHFGAKWDLSEPRTGGEGITDADDPSLNRYDLLARAFGKPPPHFHSSGTDDVIGLTAPRRDDDIFGMLGERKSQRLFDENRPLAIQDLSSILYYVFGCQGMMKLSRDLTVLKKTSPSGGSLHPTEAYPIVLNVKNLEPGFYHYSVEKHALEVIKMLPLTELKELVVDISASQEFLPSAHVLVLLITRYDRLFWKYRNHKKAYKVSLIDVGHLSQTFYLVCQAVGLGALFVGAVRDVVLEEHLELDPAINGFAGVLACGHPSADGDHLLLNPEPYSS